MDETDKILTEQVLYNKTPSVQYFYFDQNSIIKSFRMGFADIVKNKEVDPSVTYNAYSVTKTYTALAVLQLFAKGIIEINNPVIQYLPEFFIWTRNHGKRTSQPYSRNTKPHPAGLDTFGKRT